MASIRTAYRTKGMRQARRILKRIEKLGEDRSELVEAIGQTLVESAQHRLAVTNEGPDGEKWPVSRRAMRSGGRTQFDSGMAGLAGSLTYRALPGGLEIGSPLAYAAQRQFGGLAVAGHRQRGFDRPQDLGDGGGDAIGEAGDDPAFDATEAGRFRIQRFQ